MPAPNGLERSQKKLFLAVQKELAPYERLKKKELADYERAFRAAIARRKLRASSRAALLEAAKAAQVILVGDFHSFRQSQKGFIRLLEGAALKGSKAAIALECFRASQQRDLDQFLAGLITAEELREQTDFDHSWPFPWENYREILLHARAARLPILALNTGGTLRARDAAAAERIAQNLAKEPARKIFALFGELHLGRAHLPRELRKRVAAIRVVTVHQNEPSLYWLAPTLPDGQKAEVVALAPDEFCILNSVPWVKLRSYLDWLEGNPSPDFEDEAADAAGLVHHYARLLAEATGLPTQLDDAIEILPPDRLSRRSPVLRSLGPTDTALARHAIELRRTGYLPGKGALLLATVSTNAMLEAAAYLLRDTRAKRWGTDELLAHFLVGYLGSKLLNPKRKCDEVSDLRRRERDPVARRALALLAPFLKGEKLPSRARRLTGVRELEAARSAGFVLGERAFQAMLRVPGPLKEIQKLLRAEPSAAVLKTCSRRIAKARLAPASKTEKF